MQRVRITLPRLFKGHFLGGHTPAEFDRLSESERLTARLSFIAERAAILAALPYDSANGMPANVHTEARKLHRLASSTLTFLNGNKDLPRAVSAAMDVGSTLSRIDAILATAKALDVTEQLQRTEPDTRRGVKTHKAAREGARVTNQKHIEKWPEYQRDVDEMHRRSPRLSYAEICRRVAEKHEVSAKTIQRNTTNPVRK